MLGPTGCQDNMVLDNHSSRRWFDKAHDAWTVACRGSQGISGMVRVTAAQVGAANLHARDGRETSKG